MKRYYKKAYDNYIEYKKFKKEVSTDDKEYLVKKYYFKKMFNILFLKRTLKEKIKHIKDFNKFKKSVNKLFDTDLGKLEYELITSTIIEEVINILDKDEISFKNWRKQYV